ncbi:MAG: hypothetical protein OXC69_05100 [Candidatus Tectomicrobia bacterium]|nr:hypothetical protein [Candidatus Tectomicrobia bacterium]
MVSGVGVLAGAWDDQELPGKMDSDSFRRLPGDDVLCGGRGNDGLKGESGCGDFQGDIRLSRQLGNGGDFLSEPAQLFDKVLPYWGQSIIMVMHGQVGADPE